MQRNFEPMRQHVGELASPTPASGSSKTDDLPSVHRGRSGRPKAPGAESARTVLQPTARRVSTPNHGEFFECVPIGIQSARPDSAISCHGKAGKTSHDSSRGVVSESIGHENAGLFVSERNRRFHMHRSTRWDIARREGDKGEQPGHGYVSKRIGRTNTDQESPHQMPNTDRNQKPNR